MRDRNIPFVFIDMWDRDARDRERLEALKADLEQREKEQGGLPRDQQILLKKTKDQLEFHKLDNGQLTEKQKRKDKLESNKPNLSDAEKRELAELIELLATATVLDPLFSGVRSQLISLNAIPEKDREQRPFIHKAGVLPSQRKAEPDATLSSQETKLIPVFGLLQLDNVDPNNPRFPAAVPVAMGEYARGTDPISKENLFDRVLAELVADGDISQKGELRSEHVAAVFRSLRDDGVLPSNSLLPLKVRTALAKIGAGADGAANSTVDIDLPDLENEADRQIVADNLKALQALYFAAMLEEMRFFQAIDIALEQWQLGMIVLSRGAAGARFYDYWRKTSDRFSELERRSLYSRAFGIPGGEAAQGTPNREFKDLWLRFLSAVSSVARQYQVDNLLRANVPAGVSQELVRQTGRDLATNLSLHGYGMAYFAATELQAQINEIKDLLSHEEVKSAYGARDMFQVIEQIVLLAGGGVVNSIQKRVSANAGSIIIRWLADRADKLSGIGFGEILNIQAIRNPLPRVNGDKPTTKPTDADLVNAVEQWLAVNGIQDATIEEQAQAAEPPRITTRPIQVPDFAREMLGDLPIPMSAGAGNGRGNGNGHSRYARR